MDQLSACDPATDQISFVCEFHDHESRRVKKIENRAGLGDIERTNHAVGKLRHLAGFLQGLVAYFPEAVDGFLKGGQSIRIGDRVLYDFLKTHEVEKQDHAILVGWLGHSRPRNRLRKDR